MSDLTGDGSGEHRPQVIQLGGLATGTTLRPVTGSAGAPRGPEKDPFTRQRQLLSRRLFLTVLALVVVVVGGWFGVRSLVDQSHQRHERAMVENYTAATNAAGPLMAGYAFPASSGVTARAARCFLESTCGTSAATPEAAIDAVLPSLTARGLTVADRACSVPRGAEHRCTASLMLDGANIGAVRTMRDETLHTAFGVPTTVSVDIAQAGAGTDQFTSPPTPMPSDPSKVTVLPPDLMKHARCTEPTSGGCLTYTLDVRIAAAPGGTWTRAGRYAVAHDWSAEGDCPQGPQHSCVFRAMRMNDDGGVSVNATFRPDPTRLQVHADIHALEGTSAVYGATEPTGRVGHNGS